MNKYNLESLSLEDLSFDVLCVDSLHSTNQTCGNTSSPSTRLLSQLLVCFVTKCVHLRMHLPLMFLDITELLRNVDHPHAISMLYIELLEQLCQNF